VYLHVRMKKVLVVCTFIDHLPVLVFIGYITEITYLEC
jgi:hypothetical protein